MAVREKTKHTSLRIRPPVRLLADALCQIDHRDLTNLIEFAILEYGRARADKLALIGLQIGPTGDVLVVPPQS